jgi:putative DNA methylase
MGSGTTVGETLKLGARAIGRDINPVSFFAVRNALGVHPQVKVLSMFRELERNTAPPIRQWYRSRLPDGSEVQTLYYFWVKFLPCPSCGMLVDLFSSYIFVQNAYARRVPEARAICPECWEVNQIRYDAATAICIACKREFSPQSGPAKGPKATCGCCRTEFGIAKRVRELGHPPKHRMYAKMVLHEDGRKEYLGVDAFDRDLYAAAGKELLRRTDPYPVVGIEPGYNTDQVLNYRYRFWHEFFNDRQLLVVSLLADRIREIEDEHIRDVFTCLLSGTLEFNNMFTSFKGEGTGAVRHMFYHHILKPERTPLEANLWGTRKSSGSFSTLFRTRLLRGIEYAENPFELDVLANGNEKIYGLSAPMPRQRAESFDEFRSKQRDLYLSCGDSSSTDIADGSIDAVITDPPFFDNVNYSQLADFFYVWQRHILGEIGHVAGVTTRSDREVQQGESHQFIERLAAVWSEAHRILNAEGLLIFSYHHSRPEGWWSVLEALMKAAFVITASHPIKGEMSVAAPKHQAKEPIDLDIILVCRKREGTAVPADDGLREAVSRATGQIARFRRVGRKLSRNDVRVILMGQVLRVLSAWPSIQTAEETLTTMDENIEARIDELQGVK